MFGKYTQLIDLAVRDLLQLKELISKIMKLPPKKVGNSAIVELCLTSFKAF